MSADSNSGNKSFWPVKTAFKEKIVVLYDALLSVSLVFVFFPMCRMIRKSLSPGRSAMA